MPHFIISHKRTSETIFEGTYATFKDCVEDAVKQNVSLACANLFGVILSRACLIGADLKYANLQIACLHRANLQGANLYRANLRDANLSYALFRAANFRGADLRGTTLRGTDLLSANFCNVRTNTKCVPGACLYPVGDKVTRVNR